MPKHKLALKAAGRQLSGYKFDTSTYIMFNKGVRRDGATGKLVSHRTVAKVRKSKNK